MINVIFPKFLIQKLNSSRNRLSYQSLSDDNLIDLAKKLKEIEDLANLPHKHLLLLLSYYFLLLVCQNRSSRKINAALSYLLLEDDSVDDHHASRLGLMDDLYVLILAFIDQQVNSEFVRFNEELNNLEITSQSFNNLIGELVNNSTRGILPWINAMDSFLGSLIGKLKILSSNEANREVNLNDLEKFYDLSTSGYTSDNELSAIRILSTMFLSGFDFLSLFENIEFYNAFSNGLKAGLDLPNDRILLYLCSMKEVEKENFLGGLILAKALASVQEENLRIYDNFNRAYLVASGLGLYRLNLSRLQIEEIENFETNDQDVIIPRLKHEKEIRFNNDRFRDNFIKKNVFQFKSSVYKIAPTENAQIFSKLNFLYFLDILLPEFSNPLFPSVWLSSQFSKSGLWSLIESFLFIKKNGTNRGSVRYNYFKDPNDNVKNKLIIRDLDLIPSNPFEIYQTDFKSAIFRPIKSIFDQCISSRNIQDSIVKKQLNYVLLLDSRHLEKFDLIKADLEGTEKFFLRLPEGNNEILEENIEIELKGVDLNNIKIDIDFIANNNPEGELTNFLNNFIYVYLYSLQTKAHLENQMHFFDNVIGIKRLLNFFPFYNEEGTRESFFLKLQEIVRTLMERGDEEIIIISTKEAISVIETELLEYSNTTQLRFLTINRILMNRAKFYAEYKSIIVVGDFSKKLEYLNLLKVEKLVWLKLNTGNIEFAESIADLDDQASNAEIKEIGGLQIQRYVSTGLVLARKKHGNKLVIVSLERIERELDKYLGIYIVDEDDWDIEWVIEEIIAKTGRVKIVRSALWKRDLQIFFENECDSEELKLKRKLEQVSISRHILTLREWLSGSNTLLPRRGFRDVRKIYECIGKTMPYSAEEQKEIEDFQREKNKIKKDIINRIEETNRQGHVSLNIDRNRQLHFYVSKLKFFAFESNE